MKTITKLFIFITILFSPFYLKSTHIIGGTTSFRIIEVTNDFATVQIFFYLYKDASSPAQLDENISIGFYGYQNEEYSFISKQNADLVFTSPVVYEDLEGCPIDQFNYLEGVYSFQLDAPTNGYEHFTFAHLRCCRGGDIDNILEPIDTGIALTLDIYPKAFEFSGTIPPLSNFFPVQAEPGQTNSFDISIDDPFDKEYFLSVPKESGGLSGSGCQGVIPEPESCLPEYPGVQYNDPQYPYGVGASVSLDKDSGILDINIPLTSKLLFGVTLNRSSDGELISRSRQQFVLNNVSCSPSKTKNILDSDFVVWPVPTIDYINTNIPLKQVNIFDVFGDNQSKRQDNRFSTQFDVSHLSPGLYFLRGLTFDGQWLIKKIIKT